MSRARIALSTLLTALSAAAMATAQTPANPPPVPVPAPMPPPPPPSPPTGDAAQIIAVLDHFCTPAIKGEKPRSLASAMDMRRNRDGAYVLSLGGPKRIIVTPPDTSNPTVCSLSVQYDIGGDGPIYSALKGWALGHPNPYVQARDHESTQVGDETHITSTWSAVEPDGAEGLVFIQQRTADNKPLSGRTDTATILYSIRPNP